MTNPTLETTDTEYLIKFSINKFDADFVKSIFSFINQKLSVKEASTTKNVKDAEDDDFYKEDYFGHLDEK